MELQNLLNLIASLPREQQDAVEKFVQHIQQQSSSEHVMSFREALDSFMEEHAELLKRLAQ